MAAAGGDADLAAVGELLAEPARIRILQALLDGRALPAGLLASESGIAASTASAHLRRLVAGGLLRSEAHGRHRYYRLAGPEIAEVLEGLAAIAPVAPVRSLRDGTRARALRRARTCYDHLAGELGVALLRSFLRQGLLAGHDGSFRPGIERLSAPAVHSCYTMTDAGRAAFARLGVDLDTSSARPLIRHCVDWSEQSHHLAGRLGAGIARRTFEAGWIVRGPVGRSVTVTDVGVKEFAARFDLDAGAYR